MCHLYKHLTNQKINAWYRSEHHEIMRLDREIREHVSGCMECTNVSLVEQLFKRPVIVISATEVKS